MRVGRPRLEPAKLGNRLNELGCRATVGGLSEHVRGVTPGEFWSCCVWRARGSVEEVLRVCAAGVTTILVTAGEDGERDFTVMPVSCRLIPPRIVRP